jgi:DNA-binding LacI/PurR family transcriptional regulator
MQTPSLTTIRQPAREIGQIAVDILLRQLQNDAAPTDKPSQRRQPVSITLEPTLAIRQSTVQWVDPVGTPN